MCRYYICFCFYCCYFDCYCCYFFILMICCFVYFICCYGMVFVSTTESEEELFNWVCYSCSDFRYESNGIFVLGVVFFFRQVSTFYLAIFDGIFYIIQKVLLP